MASTVVFLVAICIIGSTISSVDGFTATSTSNRSISGGRQKAYTLIGKHCPSSSGKINSNSNTALYMAEGSKKKRRKRKDTPSESLSTEMPIIPDDDIQAIKEISQSGGQRPSLEEIKAIANFQAPKGSSFTNPKDPGLAGENLVDLPDIRDALKSKELKKIEEVESQKQQRKKISRKDTKAFLELLEAEPFADADSSYFEDEEYGTVSALLGEGAKPFLGIPPGPLQVGHFIGSLGIILCAFIEYPGFPLTNLPTPLRDALQGGLGVVYLINTLLAVLAVFKANERGQPAGLWAMKTFSVGGLALDQLTQLPTLKEVKEMESRKGARAIKKKK